MFLQDKTYLRTKDDLLKGCCKHYSNALGDTLTGFPVPKPANATPPIPVVETVRKRFVATKNVIIGGLLLHQTRFAQEACTGKFGKNISGDVCPSSVKTASSPFGVDPTFIVGSNVYDAATQSKLCCRPETGAVLNATNASSPPAAGSNNDADDDVGGRTARLPSRRCILQEERVEREGHSARLLPQVSGVSRGRVQRAHRR